MYPQLSVMASLYPDRGTKVSGSPCAGRPPSMTAILADGSALARCQAVEAPPGPP